MGTAAKDGRYAVPAGLIGCAGPGLTLAGSVAHNGSSPLAGCGRPQATQSRPQERSALALPGAGAAAVSGCRVDDHLTLVFRSVVD